VTLHSDDLLSTLALVQPSDHVDILYSLQIPKPGTDSGSGAASSEQLATFGSLEDVVVVSVMSSASASTPAVAGASTSGAPAGGTPKAYVLALSPQDALILKYLKDAGAVMDLALRNRTDDGDHTAQPVDMNYLIDKFQLPVR